MKEDSDPVAANPQTRSIVNMEGNTLIHRPWIINSGATEHITCDKNLLKEMLVSTQQIVHIPNGTSVPVRGSGKLELFNGINLNNVLYIPDFNCNLLSEDPNWNG